MKVYGLQTLRVTGGVDKKGREKREGGKDREGEQVSFPALT